MQNGKRKTFFTLLGLVVLVGSLTGCFDDLGSPVYEGESKLQFYPTSTAAFDASGEIPIKVQLISEEGTLPEDHQYTVAVAEENTTASSDSYEILTPTPTLEAGNALDTVRVDIQQGNIPPGETRTLTLELQPSEDGQIGVAENFQFFEITIAGKEARVAATPASITFGEVAVGNTVTDTVVVSNSCNLDSCIGTLPSEITDVQLAGSSDGAFEIVSSTGSFTLAPASSQEVLIEFAPEAAQAYTGTLSFQSTNNDPDQSSFDVNLTGTGVSGDTDASLELR